VYEVDRQLRILQLAVTQLESSIAKDGGSGFMAPSLPDLSILRTNRPLRPSTVTPVDSGEIEGGGLPAQRENEMSENVSVADKAKKGHPKTQGGRSKQDSAEASFKITLPAQPTSADADDNTYCYCNQGSFGEVSNIFKIYEVVTELLYRWSHVTAKSVSVNGSVKNHPLHRRLILCTVPKFHLECVGLEVSPEDGAPWYCGDCRPMPRRKRK